MVRVNMVVFVGILAAGAVTHGAKAQSVEQMLNYHNNLNDNIISCGAYGQCGGLPAARPPAYLENLNANTAAALKCARTGDCAEANRRGEAGIASEQALQPWVVQQGTSNSIRRQELDRQYFTESLKLQREGYSLEQRAKEAYSLGRPDLAREYQRQAQQYYDKAQEYQPR